MSDSQAVIFVAAVIGLPLFGLGFFANWYFRKYGNERERMTPEDRAEHDNDRAI